MVPLLHWGFIYGFAHGTTTLDGAAANVIDFFTRVLFSFLLLGIGSIIYLFQIPERWLIGKCDYFVCRDDRANVFFLTYV
jgi:hypothetical protein